MGRKRIKRRPEVMTEAPLAKQEAVGMGWKGMKKSWSPAISSLHWNLLPLDFQMKILACLDIQDLFRSCLLVCKQWKDMILVSQCFARLQYKHNLWGIVKHNLWGIVRRRLFSHKRLIFENGPYKILNVNLARSSREEVICCDQGIVCISNFREHNFHFMRVGNPIKDEWKLIPPPSFEFFLDCMHVDASTSPASFKIVATSYSGRNSSMLQTEIFDSKTNTWNKENIPIDGPFQDKLEGSFVQPIILQQRRIITYDFEHDRWSVKCYVSPENGPKDIILCKEEPILISYCWPCVMLWKEHSCCKGMIKWGLMTTLNIKTFLEEHKIKVHRKRSQCSYCTGHVFTVVVELSRKTALLNYDMRKGCWKLGGLMEDADCIDMEFSPSLIRIK